MPSKSSLQPCVDIFVNRIYNYYTQIFKVFIYNSFIFHKFSFSYFFNKGEYNIFMIQVTHSDVAREVLYLNVISHDIGLWMT